MTNQPVLVQTFAQPLAPDEQARLVHALTRLCQTPLDHPAIARPLAAGIDETGRPFLTHTIPPGVPLRRFLAEYGSRPFAEVVLRITQLAAAIDVAAAAGVHHGDLGARDVILAPEATGITTGIMGFGVMQALHEAGIQSNGGHTPTLADDVRALAGVAFELLQGRPLESERDARPIAVPGADQTLLHRAFSAGLGADPQVRPATAREFAAALQEAIVEAPARPDESPEVHLEGSRDRLRAPFTDLPLRAERDTGTFAAGVEPVLSLPAVPSPAAEEPLLRDVRSAHAPEAERLRAGSVPAPMFAAVAPARDRKQGGGGWFLGAAALAIGLLSGFAAGFVVGQRGGPLPTPRFAAEAMRPATPAPAQPAPATPLDGRGPGAAPGDPRSAPADPGIRIPDVEIESRNLEPRNPTPESASDPPSPRVAEASPAASDPSPRPPPNAEPSTVSALRTPTAGSQTPGRGPRAQNPGVLANVPGALQVLSRPEGAEVFLDGTLVGRTPLVIAAVQPGSHDVRIELPGHRRWATSVRVVPGEQARVAASLEQ